MGYPKKGEVLNFEARTIGKDGLVTVVKPDKIFDDEVKAEEWGVKVKVFSFPKVTPGSIIEYRYSMKMPRIRTFRRYYLEQKIPVKQYRVRLRGSSDIRYLIWKANTDAQKHAKLDKGSDGFTFELSLENLPAREKEDYMGAWANDLPWWSFNVLAYEMGGSHWSRNQDWESAFRFVGNNLFSKKYYADFKGKIDVTGCDAVCKIGRAQAWVDDRLGFRTDGGYNSRTAKEIVDAKEANRGERARILYKLLNDAGVTTRFAWTELHHSAYRDSESPNSNDLDNLILFVPQQDGIAADTWFDPQCPDGLGFVRPGHLGAEALVQRPEKKALSTEVEAKAEMVSIKAKRCENYDIFVEALDVEVDPATGTAKVRAQQRWTGIDALGRPYEDSKRSAKELQESALEHIKDHAERARLVEAKAGVREPSKMQAERVTDFEVPGWAVADGGQLVLPLSLLNSGWEDVFETKDSERKHAIRKGDDETRTELLRIRIPPGYTVASLPAPVSMTAAMFKMNTSVSQEGDVLVAQRKMHVTAGEAEPEAYVQVKALFDKFRGFRKDLDRAQKRRRGEQ